MAVDPITGQEIAPTGAAGQGEAIPPEPTIPAPLESDRMVTIPSAAKPDEERIWEFKADGEMRRMNEEQLVEAAKMGVNYTRNMQQLAPAKEMRDFIEENPGSAEVISQVMQLMQQGVPQQQAIQMVQQQAAPTGYPQQQQVDPNIDFVINTVAGLQVQMESDAFKRNHPDANFDEVTDYMLAHEDIDSLETAYRDMTYPEIARQAELYRQSNLAQNQATAVEPGAQGPPDQIRVDPRKLTPEQISEIAKLYNFIE